MGAPRKRWTPITPVDGDTPRRTATYHIDEDGVNIFCAVCGYRGLLSSMTNILVGVFIKTLVEVELEDVDEHGVHLIAYVEKRIPRTWRADACASCTDKYNDEVLHAGRINPNTGRVNQGKPFLRM